MRRSCVVCIALLLLLGSLAGQADEFRSFWVDAWHSGFLNSGETTAMIDYVKSCNCNAVIVEMSKVADSYFTSSYLPRATNVTPGYDALADIITKGHTQGLEVHCWVCVYRCWTQTTPPPWPEHVYNTHPDWLSETSTGVKFSGTQSWLDPGHPAVENWLTDAYMEIVENYDIDGFHFDRIRYPGTDWGYNPMAVARFNKEYGLTGKPNPGNTEWTDWRRAQINAFVRRFYCTALAVKPLLKVGASVWKTSLTGSRDYLQDWDAWMAGHYIDYVIPMNYTTDNGVWHANSVDNVAHAHGRHVYGGIDAISNTPSNVVWQIVDGRAVGLLGFSLYSYAGADRSALRAALTDPGTGPWASPDIPTPMPWKTSPTLGILKGVVRNNLSYVLYNATTAINGTGLSETTDGTGFYGIVDVTPGTYSVTCSANGYASQTATGVSIAAGVVTTQDFTLSPDGAPPVISDVQAMDIQATNVVITWTTDEPSTTQVEYGLDTGYGNQTPENTKLVTSHSVQLTGLAANTLYHYRVISKDGANQSATSADYTFTTIGYDTPADIILDNDAPAGVTFTGSWITGTIATEKYGADYRYCSGYTQPKTCTWQPNVITAGRYNVYAWWSDGPNRTTHAPFFVQWSGGSQSLSIDMQDPESGGKWQLLVADIPFAAGTSGYVKLTNVGVETTLNVIADAIRLEFAEDRVPPTAPTDLAATGISTSQIDLTWTASTDNVGVSGYKIFRDGQQIGTSPTPSYSDTGLATSTPYTYRVSAYDAEGNDSELSEALTRYTLPAAPTGGSVACDKETNTWYTATSFKFTATDGFGPGTRQYYRVSWDTEPTHTWTGGEEHWSEGTLEKTCEDSGSYYLHLQSCNGDGVANGTLDLGPYKYDASAPEMGAVADDGDYTDAAGQLHASWSGSDPESGIAEYHYAVGTTPENVGSVLDWTSLGTDTSVTTSGLELSSGTTYYIGVKARNGAGGWSSPAVSNGITAANVVATIAEAKALPDGKAAMLADKVVSANFGPYFYLTETDRSCGICVSDTGPSEGTNADADGVLQTVNGERLLTSPAVTPDGTGTIPDPMLLSNLALGGDSLNAYTPGVTGGVGTNNIGLLVTAVGKVTDPPSSGYFYINDGSVSGGIKVDSSMLVTKIPDQNNYVVVIGISSTEQSGSNVTRVLKPRRDSDVAIYE